MTTIPLSKTHFATVDESDLSYLSKYNWRFKRVKHGNGYAVRTGADGKDESMHHVLVGRPPPGFVVDHRNGNGLDNRRSNLRLATYAGNSQNRKKRRVYSSRFKGVFWHKEVAKWIAYIHLGGHRTVLGYYTDEVEAAKAYDRAAPIFHGEYASLNF